MPRWAEFTGGKKKKKKKKSNKKRTKSSINDMMRYKMLNYGSTMGSLGLYPSTCDPCTTLVDPCDSMSAFMPCTSTALTYVPACAFGGGAKKRKKKKSFKKRKKKKKKSAKSRLSGGRRRSVAHKKRHSKLKSAVPMKRKSNADKKRLSKGKKINPYFKKMNAARKQGAPKFKYKGNWYVRQEVRSKKHPGLGPVYKLAR